MAGLDVFECEATICAGDGFVPLFIVIDFFQSDDDLLTWNYAAAKTEVGHWLADVGSANVYSRLERIHAGESFNAVTQSK